MDLLNLDLMGPIQVESVGRKRYIFMIVDDFSIFTWMRFIKERFDTFKNSMFTELCQAEGIFHEFSTPLIPQQDGVVKRKNWTLQEMARVILHSKALPLCFWAKAINTACHIHNRISLRLRTTLTNYQLWKDWKPNVKYFHVFGSKCHILNDREYHKKWDSKPDEVFFLGTQQIAEHFESTTSKPKLL